MHHLTDEQVNEIASQVQAGNKIAAVKLYREWTGSSLLEAKQFVDGVDGRSGPATAGIAEGIDAEQIDRILDALKSGKKLNAVKIYKEASGKPLMESKAFIEDLMKELDIEDSSSGCGTVSVLVTVVAIASLVGIWFS
jgi:ribosomal protein L7/L12